MFYLDIRLINQLPREFCISLQCILFMIFIDYIRGLKSEFTSSSGRVYYSRITDDFDTADLDLSVDLVIILVIILLIFITSSILLLCSISFSYSITFLSSISTVVVEIQRRKTTYFVHHSFGSTSL